LGRRFGKATFLMSFIVLGLISRTTSFKVFPKKGCLCYVLYFILYFIFYFEFVNSGQCLVHLSTHPNFLLFYIIHDNLSATPRLYRVTTFSPGKLYDHLGTLGVDFLQFSFRWINCLFLRELPVPMAIRLWDTYLAEVGPPTCLRFACKGVLRKELKHMNRKSHI